MQTIPLSAVLAIVGGIALLMVLRVLAAERGWARSDLQIHIDLSGDGDGGDGGGGGD